MKSLYILLIFPFFVFGQTQTENYIKTTSFRNVSQGDVANFWQSLTTTELFVNGTGGGSGSIQVNNNILTVNLSGSLSTTANALKTMVKGLVATPPIPDMELGPLISIASGGNLPTCFNARIKNNYLGFYSPYYIRNINTTLSAPINTGTLSYSIYASNLYTCLPGGSGGYGGSVSISNGVVTFSAAGSWSDLCNINTGQIVYLNTVSVPNTELGIIQTNDGFASAYRAKIENNWLVIYSPTPVPPPPSSISLNVTIDFSVLDGRMEDITYYDGLGRTKQTINIRKGGNGQDVVTPFIYDNLARQTKEYLPYSDELQTSNSSSQEYRNNMSLTNSIGQLYSEILPDDFPTVPNPYKEKIVDTWGEGKILEEAAPGYSWKLDPASDLDHTTKYEYKFNTLDDKVKLYKITYASGVPTLSDGGYYQPNALYKNIIKNENWLSTQLYISDNTSIEFKDKQDKTVLKRTFNSNKWHDTYYVYDQMGNLSFVLPPAMQTYPNSQLIWPQYTSYVENDFSYYLSGHNSQYNETGIYFNESGYFYFNLYDDNGPSGPLKTGLIKDLNLTMYPNVTLGAINIKTNTGIYSDDHYTLKLQNGDLYIEGDGTVAYGVSSDIEYNFGAYEGNLGILLDAAAMDKYAYQYQYDAKKRLIAKKLPGRAWEYTVYDNLDRPILTQNANLRGQVTEAAAQTQNKWQFVKYDAFGRKLYTGIWTNPTVAQTRAEIQALVDAQTIYSENRADTATALTGGSVYYTNSTFPTSNIEIYTIQYYDSYVDIGDLTSDSSYGVTPLTNPQSLETVNKVRVISSTIKWITTVKYYNKKGQAIYTGLKNEYFNIVEKTKYKYDLSGNVVEKELNHIPSVGITVKTTDKFVFDNNNKLISQKQIIDNNPEQLILKNIYDSRGNLVKKLVGNTEASPLQEVDYSYNSRGWLKSINNPYRTENDLFVFGLNYDTFGQANTGYYNGNISGSFWRADQTDSKLKLYRYQYDALGRLKAANYGENISLGSNYKFNESAAYDRNGNILSMTRYSQNPTNINASVLIDNLQYTYSGNKVMSIKDSAANIKGFNDFNTVGDDYMYDQSGNLLIDKNKKITSQIVYNHLDLPTTITFTDGSKITYIYDANGGKLSKQVLTAGNFLGTITQYTGNFVYQKVLLNNPVLQFFTHPEGYVANNGGVFSYIYQYKDHLGNVRVSYSDVNNDGIIKSATSEVFYDGFESASGWTSTGAEYGGQVNAYDNTRRHSGKYSGKISKPTTGELYVHSNTWTPINNSQPTEYILSGWVYSDSPSSELWLFARKLNENTYPAYAYSVATSSINNWVYLEKRIVVPADAVLLNVRLDNNGGGNVWFDDINIRKVDGSAVVEIIEDNSYYPFGLKHENNSPFTIYNGNAIAQKFKFGGKEYDSSFDINTYDFGARNYDPAIGRWMNIDPSAEKSRRYSPYNYAFNNPIYYVDPDGMYPLDWIKNMANGQYIWNNNVTSVNNTPVGYSYIGSQDTDIVNDLFGGSIFRNSSRDIGTVSFSTFNNKHSAEGAAANHALTNTTLSIALSASVTTSFFNGQLVKTFNGININATVSGTVIAPYTDLQLSLAKEYMNLQNNAMKPFVASPYGNFIQGGDVASLGYSNFWTSKSIENNFKKSYNLDFDFKGLYNFGGGSYLKGVSFSGLFGIPNYTNVSVSVPFQNIIK